MKARKSILAGLAALACLAAAAPAAAANPVATAFDTQSGNVQAVTPGPDGALWIAGPKGVSKIAPGGEVTQVATLTGDVRDIVAGPDGNLWVTEDPVSGEQSMIARVTPAGVVTEFSEGLTEDRPVRDIVVGPDGALWFTEYSNEYEGPDVGFGRITTAGTISELPAPGASGFEDIVTGPDGRLWFSERYPFRIGAMTTSGEVETWKAGLGKEIWPGELAAGPDGDVWFARDDLSKDDVAIDRIDAEGNVTPVTDDFLLGTSIKQMVTGSDGYVYAVDRTFDLIYRIAADGEVTAMTGGIGEKFKALDAAFGDDGNLWMPSLRKVWRLLPELENANPPEVTIEPAQATKIVTRKKRVKLSFDIAVDPESAELACDETYPGEPYYYVGCGDHVSFRTRVYPGKNVSKFSVLAEADGLVDPTPPEVITTIKVPKPGKGKKH